VRACGIVTLRQQPETAKGTMFVSLEDETGSVQVIVWPQVKAMQRLPLLRSRLMAVRGSWQREGEVRNLVAGQIEDLSALLGRLAQQL
jgi:error-prone DNA polymerase